MQKIRAWLLLLAGLLLAASAAEANRQVIAGAGPSTKVVELFFAQFRLQPSAAGYEFVVPPMSTKHAGGIRNSNGFLFGRTGRPLNEKERALNKEEIYLAKVPIAFATGEGINISTLTIPQLEQIFLGKISNWKELGGPDARILRVGREPTEALLTELKGDLPFFNEATFDVIFLKDDQVVEFLKLPIGQYAIAFGAEPNFSAVKPLVIEGDFQAGVRLGLVYDLANADHPLVQAVSSYANSDEWRTLVRQANLIPVAR